VRCEDTSGRPSSPALLPALAWLRPLILTRLCLVSVRCEDKSGRPSSLGATWQIGCRGSATPGGGVRSLANEDLASGLLRVSQLADHTIRLLDVLFVDEITDLNQAISLSVYHIICDSTFTNRLSDNQAIRHFDFCVPRPDDRTISRSGYLFCAAHGQPTRLSDYLLWATLSQTIRRSDYQTIVFGDPRRDYQAF
jgi:hypothetical protein